MGRIRPYRTNPGQTTASEEAATGRETPIGSLPLTNLDQCPWTREDTHASQAWIQLLPPGAALRCAIHGIKIHENNVSCDRTRPQNTHSYPTAARRHLVFVIYFVSRDGTSFTLRHDLSLPRLRRHGDIVVVCAWLSRVASVPPRLHTETSYASPDEHAI